MAGVASAVGGLGVAQLLAVPSPEAAPVVAVGRVVVDRTPAPVKDWAIATFGTADKLVLHIGVLVVVAMVAVVAGRLTARRAEYGAGLFIVLGAVAAAAAVSAPDAGPYAVLPSLGGSLAAAAMLVAIRRSPHVPREAPAAGPDRRSVLRGSAYAAATGIVTGAGGWALGHSSPPPVTALPAVPAPLPPLPVGLDGQISGVSALQTAVADFYRIDTALVVPRVNPDEWRLTIDGMVKQPVTLTLADLLAMPTVEHDATMLCVSNPVGGDLVGSARWTGVKVADLLERAGPLAGSDMVLSTSVDGWTAGTPLSVLRDGRLALLAVGMNGAPLTPAHGAPVRLVTPGLYGYVGATKWLRSLTVTTFARDAAYWTVRGWSALGPVKTGARIDTPRTGARVAAGQVPIAGVAWATHRGIESVEVSIDGGPWRTARLGPDVGIDYWRQWVLDWPAEPGSHTLRVRAVDGTGAVQTGEQTPPDPDGATGWHTVVVTIT